MTGLGVAAGALATRSTGAAWVWQIDPAKCLHCGNCATQCVLEQSAVKCVHAYAVCGYCQLCTGFFAPEPERADDGGGEPALPDRPPSSAPTSRTPIINIVLTNNSASAAPNASKAATASATARSSCKSATTAASTATSAPSPAPVPATPSAACRWSIPICSKPPAAKDHASPSEIHRCAGSDVAPGVVGFRRAAFPAAGF